MTLTRSAIEAMAPDQGSLSAASALLKAAKWPVRAQAGALIWGECQGSGANPYRVVAETADIGSKCTCPSRKFPCKHALALMWMFVDDSATFEPGEIPAWVQDWMGRRRKGASAPATASAEPKSIALAQEETAKPADPAAEARKQASAAKRAQDTRKAVRAGLDDLDIWLADQLRGGLTVFVNEPGERCRRIAARLVDAKAGALAGRIDEMPSRLLALPTDERVDAVIMEFGKLVLLMRAWRATPDDPELRREVVSSETREDVLNNPEAPYVSATWEVLGERVSTRRDGLVSQATWLLQLDAQTPRFALLLDFFPASAGKRGAAFIAGDRFQAELVFYPASAPLRAVIASRSDAQGEHAWPAPPSNPLAAYAAFKLEAPWRIEAPLLLPQGRIAAEASGRAWWKAPSGAPLQLRTAPPPLALGADISKAAALWDGARLGMIAAQSNWGRIDFDA
ncbi:MAG: SWIM zinc finger domain-containing protein [Hyphomonadaceae bacterium]|nr:SWIM zinc finger domain-containing protein [Hyphomonadaceae bacterium]